MGFLDGLFGGALSSSNHDSPLGNLGKKFQKYTDPLAMIGGDKYVNLTSVEIPRLVNTGLSKVMQPFEKVDKTINPVRRYVPGVDQVGDWVAAKPGSTIGALAGSYFAAPALAGAAGGAGAGGAVGGAAGAEGAGALGGFSGFGSGAAGYGGGVSSSVLPGIFEGGSVGSGTGAGAGIFGGGAGTGSITGAGGMFGAGGGNLFGGGGMNPMMQQLMQQGMKNMGGGQSQGAQQQTRPLAAAQDQQQPGAMLTPFQPIQLTPAMKAQILANALKQYNQ